MAVARSARVTGKQREVGEKGCLKTLVNGIASDRKLSELCATLLLLILADARFVGWSSINRAIVCSLSFLSFFVLSGCAPLVVRQPTSVHAEKCMQYKVCFGVFC